MSSELSVVPLTPAEIDENLALVRAVGWPDVAGDWRVLHEAAWVLGARRDGHLVGQGALGLFGTAGTIAKMVVSPDAQRQGIGLRLLDALLGEATRRSMSVLGLVATPFGAPLYESRDFARAGDILIHMGTAALPDQVAPPTPLDHENRAPEIEQRFVACSREVMLRARFREACATSLSLDPDGRARGFAMATSLDSLALIGPVIAETDEDAQNLVSSICAQVRCPVRIDVPADRVAFRAWLDRQGVVEKAVRPEMVRGAATLPWQIPQRFALATQAWG